MVVKTLHDTHSRNLFEQFFQLSLLENMVVSLINYCFLVGVQFFVFLFVLTDLLHLVESALVFELVL